MNIDLSSGRDSIEGLHDRLRASAFWIGLLGFVVNGCAFIALYLLGDTNVLLFSECFTYSVVLGSISVSAYRDFYVRYVLYGGLLAIYLVFWMTAYIFAWRGESILLSLPLVIFVPLLVTMVLPHQMLFSLVPIQFIAMLFYVVEFALPGLAVNLPDSSQFYLGLGLACFSSVSLLALGVLAMARHDSDKKLIKLVGDKERIASIDPLTKLLNRRAFMQQLEAQWPPAQPLALAFIDLNHFKPLNDQYGHALGDMVLREVADRLGKVTDVIATARLGGDEFAVCCSNRNGLYSPEAAANVMHDLIVADFQSDMGPIPIGASVGYAVYDQSIGSLTMLLRAADAAMRRAKSTRSGWATFSHHTDSAALKTSSIEFELKAALRKGNIRAALQPIARVSNLEVVEYELLARWVNSGLEQDPGPAQFIPVAESQGVLNDILWVILAEALEVLDLNQYKLAVNVSPAQLSAGDFLDTLLDMLADHGVDPRSITLEVTEEVVFRNLERNVAVLDRARDSGMSVALDDFGSGYSSLSMLDSLPLDKLKIDQEIVQKAEYNQRSANILQAAITLAQQLGLLACVEGVETDQSLHKIVAMGADQVQGYQIGKPLLLQGEFVQDSAASSALSS